MMDNLPYVHEHYGTVKSHTQEVPSAKPAKNGNWWDCITVEPIVGFYSISSSLSLLVVQNLLIKKICWPDAEPGREEECPNEAAVEVAEAGIITWASLINNFFPIFFVLFGGSWSDNNGGIRKPLMILPVLGQMITDILLIFNSIFWQWSPTIAALSYSLPSGMCGGRVTISIGILSYIADITTHKNRTFRLSIVVALVFLGMPVGTSLGGALNKYLGFPGTFALSVVLNVLGLISLLRVKESGDRKKAKHSKRCFNFRDVLQSIYTITRRRQGYHRCCIILLGLSIFFLLGPFIGEYSVLYLFVRMKFGWTTETFGYFAGVKMIVLFFEIPVLLGTIWAGYLDKRGLSLSQDYCTPVIVRILSLYLKVSDALIGILACILQMIPSLIYPFVEEGWIMYIVTLTEFMHGTAFTVQKAIVTKLVSKDEMGQVNSFMCFTEALVPIVMIPLYNILYQHTIHKFPGAFFLFTAGITVPAIGIFIVVYFLLDEKQSLDITNPEISFRKEEVNIQSNETWSTSINVKSLK